MRLFIKRRNFITLLMILTLIIASLWLSLARQDANGMSVERPDSLSQDVVLGPKNSTAGDGLINPCALDVVVCAGENISLSPVKKGASKQTQERIDYAWSISHNKDFIYTIEAENRNWSTKTVGITGDRGICQISPRYHPKIVYSPKFKDWKWQIDQCWKLYKGGTRFYGYDVRYKVINRFKYAQISN